MTAYMDIIPSRPPPKSSPKQHRHYGTGVSKAHDEDDDDDEEEDDGKSMLSAHSEVSVRTLNTRNLIRGTSFSPQTANPYADLPLRSPHTSQTIGPTTRPAHREAGATQYQSDRLRPPPPGASRRYDQAPRSEYNQSPNGSIFRPESTERSPPPGPTRSREFRDDTQSRDYGQSPTSPGQYSSADNTRNDKQRLMMPNVEDFIVPSATDMLQYREASPIEQRTALRAGYNRSSYPNAAADYANTPAGSPSTQQRGHPRRTSRGLYPEKIGDD